jgi:hypothetical protein
MKTKTKIFLINLGLSFVALTLVHMLFHFLWNSEGSPFLRLIIAGVYAYFYPMYTPIHYKELIVQQPFFSGRGNHSVKQLEDMCEQFQEYVHQQQIIKQNCMKHIVELKFDVELPTQNNQK